MSEQKVQKKYIGYCQECESFQEGLLRKKHIKTIVKGIEIEAIIFELYCEKCGDLLTNKELQKTNDIIIFDAYKKKMNLLTSIEIKAIREKRGWSQSQMAKFIGVGEKDITRYENGAIQTKSIDNLMKLVDNDTVFCYLDSILANDNFNDNSIAIKTIFVKPNDKIIWISNIDSSNTNTNYMKGRKKYGGACLQLDA